MKQRNPYLEVPALPDAESINLIDFLNAEKKNIEIEIGFGKGHFLLERAAAAPDAVILGIETRRKWVHLVQSRIQKWRRTNAIVLHGNAREAFPRFVPDGGIARVFIHFPDPWWKARHEKRMVICPELLVEATRLLEDDGDLFVQTDVDFRADHYQQLLVSCEALYPAEGDGRVAKNPFLAHSLRETKAESVGLPIFRLHFKRRSRLSSSR